MTPPGVQRLGAAVLVQGAEVADLAYLVAAGLRHLSQRDGIPTMARWVALQRTLQLAADDHRASLIGNGGLPSPAESRGLRPDDPISTGEAAVILNLTPRQVRNIAGQLGARRAGRALVLDRTAVLAEAARRKSATEER